MALAQYETDCSHSAQEVLDIYGFCEVRKLSTADKGHSVGLVMFLDESGDHNLVRVESSFPIFCLAGCVFDQDYYQNEVRPMLDDLKARWMGGNSAILHSRDIRKRTGEFAWLHERSVREAFFNDVNRTLSEMEFTIVAAVIYKLDHFARYSSLARHPYHLGLEFLMERFELMLRERGQQGYVLAESRGRKEDLLLLDEFFRLRHEGTPYLRIDNVLSIYSYEKQRNIAGLQIADLTAYPVAARVLRPSVPNLAFDILYSKIRKHPRRPSRILGHGLKIFPQASLEHYMLWGR